MKDNEDLMSLFRTELRRAVAQRFKRVDLARFKMEMRDYVTYFMYENTGHIPVVIPVINAIGGNANTKSARANTAITPEKRVQNDQQRFAEMRARLLGQDQRD